MRTQQSHRGSDSPGMKRLTQRWRRILLFALSGLLVVGAAGGTAGGYHYWKKRLSPEALDLRGAQLMLNCRRCHSIVAGLGNTGPSLIGIWNRQAGTLEGYDRYSPALRASNIVWTAETLDKWLKDPVGFIPGSQMVNGAVEDDTDRANIIRFLERANAGIIPLEMASGRGDYGYPAAPHTAGHILPGMGGRVSNEHMPLRELPPERQVSAISLCGDTYTVTHGDGSRVQFWESNIRFKTDSSAQGPRPGVPAILPSSTMGDRVTMIFATPAEIGHTVRARCESPPVARAPESRVRR
jgi:cytochrome c